MQEKFQSKEFFQNHLQTHMLQQCMNSICKKNSSFNAPPALFSFEGGMNTERIQSILRLCGLEVEKFIFIQVEIFMIIILNGTLGVGKTTTSDSLNSSSAEENLSNE